VTPISLSPTSFQGYAPQARLFAIEHLPLLKRLPLAICPSFLQQIQDLDTSFPVEQRSLRWQCSTLQAMPTGQYVQLTAALEALTLSDRLRAMDWVHGPARFVTELTAYLWSSSQINQFRQATNDLFAAVQAPQDTSHRLVVVVLGQGAEPESRKVLRKLRQQGVFLNALRYETAFEDIRTSMQRHVGDTPAPYATWYADGGVPRTEVTQGIAGSIAVSYPGLAKLRERVLARMQMPIGSGGGGAEQMHARLTETSQRELNAQEITGDPVLQRFYTELFTQSSGPQLFSTSFVQWTGRELARRAQPHTLLLRYAPRQKHQDFNEMFSHKGTQEMDAQGALRDAEMGAYYNWIETNRITAPGKLTFAVWVEDRPLAVILGPRAPADTVCSTPMTLQRALENFG